MQHREYLEVVQLAEVPHRVDFDTLGAHQAFKITYMQEVVDEAAAELLTNEHTQRRQTSIHTEGKSTTHTTSRGNKNLCVYSVQRSNLAQRETQDLAQRGTQEEQLRGETENRRWSEREKQKERKKQRFEGEVRERKREIDL